MMIIVAIETVMDIMNRNHGDRDWKDRDHRDWKRDREDRDWRDRR